MLTRRLSMCAAKKVFLWTAILFILKLPMVESSGCLDGTWTPRDANCYKSFELRKTWSAAEAYCASLDSNGHLTSISSPEENTFVNTLTQLLDGSKSYWIGLKKHGNSANFDWSDGTASSYSFWNSIASEPDQSGQCVAMATGSMWEDEDCNIAHEFICEAPGKCPTMQAVSHASRDTADRFLGAVVTYTCSAGFKFPDGNLWKTFVCESDTGTWNDTLEDCVAKDCPAAPVLTHATADSNVTSQNTTVTYTCHSGYHYSEGVVTTNITCQQDSTWTATPQDCIVKQCNISLLPSVDNSRMFGLSANAFSTTYFSCYTGMEFPDKTITKSITCTVDAMWDPPSLPNCREKSCPEPPVINNTIMLNNASSYPYLTEINYRCIQYHKFPDLEREKSIYCNYYDQWSPRTLEPCELHLGSCRDISYLLPYRASADTNATVSDTVATVSCEYGYRFSDGLYSRPAVCDKGDWNTTVTPELSCDLVNCSKIPTHANSTRVGVGIMFGAEHTYTCDNGSFFLDGTTERTIKCNGYGQWRPNLPECKGTPIIIVINPPDTPPVEAPAAVVAALASVPLACVLGIIGTVIILDIATLGRHLAVMKENLKHFKYRLEGKDPPVVKKKKKGPRPTCEICCEVGHETKDCNLCKYCHTDEHKSKDCPFARRQCKRCRFYGHTRRECEEVQQLLAILSRDMYHHLFRKDEVKEDIQEEEPKPKKRSQFRPKILLEMERNAKGYTQSRTQSLTSLLNSDDKPNRPVTATDLKLDIVIDQILDDIPDNKSRTSTKENEDIDIDELLDEIQTDESSSKMKSSKQQKLNGKESVNEDYHELSKPNKKPKKSKADVDDTVDIGNTSTTDHAKSTTTKAKKDKSEVVKSNDETLEEGNTREERPRFKSKKKAPKDEDDLDTLLDEAEAVEERSKSKSNKKKTKVTEEYAEEEDIDQLLDEIEVDQQHHSKKSSNKKNTSVEPASESPPVKSKAAKKSKFRPDHNKEDHYESESSRGKGSKRNKENVSKPKSKDVDDIVDEILDDVPPEDDNLQRKTKVARKSKFRPK